MAIFPVLSFTFVLPLCVFAVGWLTAFASTIPKLSLITDDYLLSRVYICLMTGMDEIQPQSGQGTSNALLTRLYGAQIAREYPLIEEVLQRTSHILKMTLSEGDLDAVCRQRQSKINIYSQQEFTEQFEPLRLLNMTYEGVITFLEEAAKHFSLGINEDGLKRIDRSEKIILYFVETLDFSAGGDIARDLLRLYEFSINHLAEAKIERSPAKTLEVRDTLRTIYLGYLELEVQQDIETFLKKKIDSGRENLSHSKQSTQST